VSGYYFAIPLLLGQIKSLTFTIKDKQRMRKARLNLDNAKTHHKF